VDRAIEEDSEVSSLTAAVMLVEAPVPDSRLELRAITGRLVAAEAEYSVSDGMMEIVEASSWFIEEISVLALPTLTLVAVASAGTNDVITDESISELRLDVTLLGKAVASMLRAVSVVGSNDMDIPD
jgi:hypothetical protein